MDTSEKPEPGACGDPECPVLHADPANPIHPPTEVLMATKEAAIPARVGECRWCGTDVFSDLPRLSRGSNVWHRNCAVNEAHWLRTQLGGGFS